RLVLPPAHRRVAPPRLLGGRRAQDPGRERPAGLPPGRAGRQAAPRHHPARSRRNQARAAGVLRGWGEIPIACSPSPDPRTWPDPVLAERPTTPPIRAPPRI